MSTGTSMVDPFKLAKQQRSVEGEIELVNFSRASELLESEIAQDLGSVSYVLHFAFDTDGVCVISGELSATYSVKCKRCMRFFLQNIVTTFKVSPVCNDQEAKALSDEYDPAILTDSKLNIVELIEDEFILAMPIVQVHQLGSKECIELVNETEAKLNNPFEVLQDLKVNTESYKAGDK